MIFVGIDVHCKNSVICFLDPQLPPGQQCRTVTCPTTPADFARRLRPLEGKCKIAFEVGTQTQWLAGIFRPLAAEVQVANPGKIPWLFRDRRKNDALDAHKLATLLYLGQLPTVHLPSADVSAWRSLINYRRTLVQRRVAIKNQIRALARAFGHRCPHRCVWTSQGVAWLRSLTFDAVRTMMMTSLLDQLRDVEVRRVEVECQLDAIAATHPHVALLQTIRGIGPRTAEAVVAFADQIARFARSRQLGAYFGMTPGLDASAEVVRYGHITKQGPSVVRWVLVEAAHQAIRHAGPLRDFYKRVCRERKDRSKKAIVAVSRKMLTIMFAMLRDGTEYHVERVGAAERAGAANRTGAAPAAGTSAA
jgi:transposase